jgi:cobalamin biosynthesis Mg chelatase CobN
MESLTVQNQQLSQQNQQLRVEIERVVQSALQLRQTADAHLPANQLPAHQTPISPSALQGLELHFQSSAVPVNAPNAAPEALEPGTTTPKPLFTEQEGKLRQSAPKERSTEMGGWWLAIVICFIIVTAFGTGFFIVRPLLPSR